MLNIFNRKVLPKEGTIYTHKSNNCYNGITGIVYHHGDKKAFMIFTGSNWLVNIKPI